MTAVTEALDAMPDLAQRMRCLATLDAILMPEWQFRYYSFNAAWGPQEQMGSMRDGEGNELFVHFSPAGVFMVGNDHERPIDEGVFSGLPTEFEPSRAEPAFQTENANLCAWKLEGGRWQTTARPQPWDLLDLVLGTAADYARWAEEYYEVEVPLAAVEHVFGGRPLTADIVASLNPDVTLEDLAAELESIG